METTTVIPASTPAPVAPAAVAQSAPAGQQATTPTIDTTANVAISDTNPLSSVNIQKRIDEFVASKKAPASGEQSAAAGTPAVADTAAAVPTANAATPEAAATPANGEAPAADAAAAPADAPTAAETASGDPAPELIVELPPRNANGNPLKIAAPDAATADALRRLNNGYLRGEEARAKFAEADAQLARVREVEIMLQADPLGLVERMPAQQRADIARTMLAEHFEELKPTIEKWWNDDSERRLARADSLEKRADARTSYESSRTVAQQVRAVSDAVRTLIPDTADTADAQEFYQDAVTHLANIARGRESGLVTPQEVAQLLERRVQRFGFKPGAVATTTTAPATTSNAAPASAPAPAAQSAAAPAASVPTQNVARVHAVNQARAAAAATSVVGAGATPVTTMAKPPKGLSITEAADWAIAQSRARGA